MNIKIPKNELLYCKYCNTTFPTGTRRNRHLKEVHKKNYTEYILDVYLNGIEPVCKCGCGTKTKFGVLYGNIVIPEFTKNHAPKKPHTEETKCKIQATLQKTMLSKYGVTNPMHLQIFKDKIIEVKQEKYGFRNYNNIEKSKQTKLENYGNPYYNNPEKRERTFIEKYNGYTFSSLELMEKVKATKITRYGDPYYNNTEKNRQTKIDRYGTDKIRLNSVKHSKYEKIIAEQIEGEHKFLYHGKEFDIRKDNYLIEIDGDYYHPTKAENLTITQLNNFINDYEKFKIVQEYNEYTLIKVYVSQLSDVETLESLIQKSYIPDFKVELNQKIISKEYLEKFIQSKGLIGFEKYIKIFSKFIQVFAPDIIIEDLSHHIKCQIGIDPVNKISDFSISNILK